jgi:putative PIN family toxin of toxin-antitoxin system
MKRAVLDTNVVVQSLISSPRSASARVLDAYYDGQFELSYSPATLDEVIDVLQLPAIRQRHGLADDELLEFVATVFAPAHQFAGERHLSHKLTRDVTDTKFLALAEESQADYIVTNDRRHLLQLRQHGPTRIVTPTQFLAELR